VSTTVYKRVYDVGDVYPSVVEFETFSGDAADPASVTIDWFPAGSATGTRWAYGQDSEVVRDELGQFHAPIPLTTAGQWRFEWLGAGGNPESSIRGAANTVITVRPTIAEVFLAITPDELETFMQRALDTDTARETILDITGEAESVLHRGIGQGVRTEQHNIKRASTYMLVDGGPINEVVEVIVDGSTLVAGTDYSFDRNGILLRPALNFTADPLTGLPLPAVASVTYVGGISKQSRVRALQSIVKARCARRFMMNKAHVNGLTSQGMEGYSISIMPDEFTDKEMEVLKANALPSSAAQGGRFGVNGDYTQEPFWFNDIPRGGDNFDVYYGP
jgi:hypothetical protein